MNELVGLIASNNGQTPPADANPLVDAHNGNQPPATGGAVVTLPLVVCTVSGQCAIMPATATPGTAGYVASNATFNNGSGDSAQDSNGGQSDASVPVGSKSNQFNQPKNQAISRRVIRPNVGGTDYAGHALNRMQDRRLTPSVIQNTIENGVPTPSRGGTTVFYDSVNNASVVINSAGKVITVEYGK